jgi:hypothetical protein
MGLQTTLMDKALAAFNYAGTCLSVFRTDPCLFPRYKTYSIEDYSLATDNCYPSQEGARMVGLTSEALQKTTHIKVLKRKANIIIVRDKAADDPEAKRDRTTRSAVAIRRCKSQ